MIPVQENMAKLTDEDRAAIAAYLKTLPPGAGRWEKVESGGVVRGSVRSGSKPDA